MRRCVRSGAVRLSEDAAPPNKEALMPNFGPAWAVGTSALVALFGVLSTQFDPAVAFALSLAAVLAMKN